MKNTQGSKRILSIIAILVVIVVLFPVVNVVLRSLMSNAQSLTSDLFPNPISLEGYKGLTGTELLLPFIRTIIIALIATFLSVILTTLVSFALSRDEFKQKELVIVLIMVWLTIPATALMTARFGLMQDAGLLNTYIAVIIPSLFSASSILILRSYMQEIPDTLIEMVIVNGGSLKEIMFDVVIPYVKPGIVIVALLCFIGSYNMYNEPLLYITDPDMQTLQVALRDVLGVSGENSTKMVTPNVQMASIVATLSIIIVIIPILNRFYVKGMTDGGIK